MKRVLIVAAHPDDEVLGCGATISKYRASGVVFRVVFIGEGSSCRFDDPSDVLADAATKQRTASAIRAMQLLGIEDFEFHDLPCGRLDQVPIIAINKIIERAVRDFGPDTILTHSSSDVNNDHRIVFGSTLMATRPGAQNHVARVLSYEVPSSSEWSYSSSFAPNLFEEVREQDLLQKCAALDCYESEIRPFPFPRSEQGLRTLAMFRGMQAGFNYADAFHIVREFRR